VLALKLVADAGLQCVLERGELVRVWLPIRCLLTGSAILYKVVSLGATYCKGVAPRSGMGGEVEQRLISKGGLRGFPTPLLPTEDVTGRRRRGGRL
jgi:hypothetical protein